MRLLPTPITQPGAEPVTRAQAKLDCRIDDADTSLDAVLDSKIATARRMAEHETGRKLITQVWRAEFADWPTATDVITLSPAQSAAVSYWSGSDWVALNVSQFVMLHNDTSTGVTIVPALNVTWPTLAFAIGPRVRVDVTVGYGDEAEDVPECIRDWIRAHVAAMVRKPEATTDRAETVLP
ncbi:MAG: hypothetical protein K2X42_11495, partial [Burkholderiaceae bacterium]|nr:hypothetical protein [Burkholderiaceae bacterium]